MTPGRLRSDTARAPGVAVGAASGGSCLFDSNKREQPSWVSNITSHNAHKQNLWTPPEHHPNATRTLPEHTQNEMQVANPIFYLHRNRPRSKDETMSKKQPLAPVASERFFGLGTLIWLNVFSWWGWVPRFILRDPRSFVGTDRDYISYFIYHISYFMFHFSYIIYHISYIIFHVSYIIYHISYFMFHISYISCFIYIYIYHISYII